MKQLFKKLSKNESFIRDAVSIIDWLCPVKYSPATKYSNKDYLMGILEVFEKFTYWRDYEGLIKWKTLNDKFNKWCKLKIFDELHQHFLTKYLKKNKTKKLKLQSLDSTPIANKQGCKLVAHNGFIGRKRYIKLSSVTDISGVPLGIHVFAGNKNDTNSIEDTLDAVPIELDTEKHKNNNRYKQYLLADSGYCSAANRLSLQKRGYNPLIWYNKRNNKNEAVLKRFKFNRKQARKYIQRRIVESSFAWLKKFPKINSLYEKNISSFCGFVLLAACRVAVNKT
jgi:transposase